MVEGICGLTAVDTRSSVDTIDGMALQEALTVTHASTRSAFEQQLCRQLLSLGEVAEILADRVMALETRLSALEDRQVSDASSFLMDENTGELLSAGEAKVQMLRERLGPTASETPMVVDLNVNHQSEENHVEQLIDAVERVDHSTEDDSVGEDTEYVDDPQIGLLSA